MTAMPAVPPVLRRPFVFLRHGETESNLAGTIAGSLDVALTPLGHAQARAAADALRHGGITAIYSSGLRRALDTARYASRALGLPATVVPELAERDWGELEGRPRSERTKGVTPPGAETFEQYAARVMRGFGKVDSALPLIVAHSGVFRVLCRTLGVPEAAEPVSNARPVRFFPPDARHASWRCEIG